jgi:putative SbcD/Mre11-related phosphoesterase
MLLRKGRERALIVADLHVGWEVALADEGIHVPSQTFKMLDKLLKLIDYCSPTRILMLGDIKHTIARVELGEWKDIPELFETLTQRVKNVEIVLGNHDGNLEPLLPSSVKIFPSTGTTIADVGFFHGNAWPSPELLQCHSLVIGHVHPTVMFRDPLGFRITAQVWIKTEINQKRLAKAFLNNAGFKMKAGHDPFEVLRKNFKVRLKASELFIMPYFNDFLGGRPVNRKSSAKRAGSVEYLGPILRGGNVDIENAEVYLLDGAFLGTVNQLRTLT